MAKAIARFLGWPVRLVNTIVRRQTPHITVNVCLAL